MVTGSSILPWKIPWTVKPDGLQSMRSQRARHNWATEHAGRQASQIDMVQTELLMSPSPSHQTVSSISADATPSLILCFPNGHWYYPWLLCFSHTPHPVLLAWSPKYIQLPLITCTPPTLVRVTIVSRLDYCSSLQPDFSASALAPVQSVFHTTSEGSQKAEVHPCPSDKRPLLITGCIHTEVESKLVAAPSPFYFPPFQNSYLSPARFVCTGS